MAPKARTSRPCLHAGEARAGEHEREPAPSVFGRGVGQLDLAQHVVAEIDRVAEILEGPACSRTPGASGRRATEPGATTCKELKRVLESAVDRAADSAAPPLPGKSGTAR